MPLPMVIGGKSSVALMKVDVGPNFKLLRPAGQILPVSFDLRANVLNIEGRVDLDQVEREISRFVTEGNNSIGGIVSTQLEDAADALIGRGCLDPVLE